MDVTRLSVLVFPRNQHLLRVASHDLGVRRDTLAVKCRLRKSPLTQPRFAFVGQQTVAEEPSALAHDVVLEKILVVPYQYRFDQARMIQEIDVNPRRAIIKDVA